MNMSLSSFHQSFISCCSITYSPDTNHAQQCGTNIHQVVSHLIAHWHMVSILRRCHTWRGCGALQKALQCIARKSLLAPTCALLRAAPAFHTIGWTMSSCPDPAQSRPCVSVRWVSLQLHQPTWRSSLGSHSNDGLFSAYRGNQPHWGGLVHHAIVVAHHHP